MLPRGEFNILSYSSMRTFQIENPRSCSGFFRFSDDKCLNCPFRVECESQFVTEYGFSGRPSTILKEYFYVAPFLYKIILPEKATDLFPYLVPKHLPKKIQQIIRRQLRIIYKMHVRSEVFQRWEIFALKESSDVSYYAKIAPICAYTEWFDDDQAKRIAFVVRSLVTRLCNSKPTCVISIELTGWLIHNVAKLTQFEFSDFMFWSKLKHLESNSIRRLIEEQTGELLNKRRIPLVELEVQAVVIWEVTEESFFTVLKWIYFNRTKIRYLVVMLPELKFFNLLQVYFFPLAIWVHSKFVHFPLVAVFKLVRLNSGKKLVVREEALNEVKVVGRSGQGSRGN